MFQTKVVEKIKNTHFVSNTYFCFIFFFKLFHLLDNVDKYCRARQATDDSMAHALYMVDN